MSRDIRSFFSPKSAGIKSDVKNNRSKSLKSAKKSFLSDSDSEEEINETRESGNDTSRRRYGKLGVKRISSLSSSDEDVPAKRRKNEKGENTRKKPIKPVISDDSSDEEILSHKSRKKYQPREEDLTKDKKLKIGGSRTKSSKVKVPEHLNSSQRKLAVVTESKYFKPAKPEDVFGTEPVKQCDNTIQHFVGQDKSSSEQTEEMEEKVLEKALLQVEAMEQSQNEVEEESNKQIRGKNDDEQTINNRNRKRENEIPTEETKKEKKEEKEEKNKKSIEKLVNNLKRTEAEGKSDEGFESPGLTRKKGPKTDSSGYVSSPSVNEKSSPGSRLDSQNLFVDSQDSGIMVGCHAVKEERSLKVEKVVETKVPVPGKSMSVNNSSTVVASAVNEKKDKKLSMLWVEKYKPQSTSKLIGQQGERSNVNKLKNWLSNWYKNNAGRKKTNCIPNGWHSDPNGYDYKAAILCGPPGVGKTTSVALVCKEMNFDLVEFNASDTRSKNSLQEQISELLTSTSLNSSFGADTNRDNNVTINRKRVLVMDEVDGMAGNEDRGGIQELISLIKRSKVPIICICNDRSHPKIRSLLNYCFELRYSRPRAEQIKGYMMSICYKESMNISPNVLMDIIVNSNNDIRLTLNHLSMLAADKSNTNLCSDKKNVKIGSWDVVRMVFSLEEHKKMTIHDKCELFFYDYNLAPLFVHENYLSVKPSNLLARDKIKKMEMFATAANSIATGEEIETCIRKSSAWSLLPVQAIFSSYVPGFILEGHCSGQINFPSWFAQNSKQSKMSRLSQEIQVHTRLKVSGSKRAILLDYIHHLRSSILTPLMQHGTDGVKTSLDKLHDYDLLKEDLDSLNEMCTWPQKENMFSKIDSKVKAAFTRLYNKEKPASPYSLTAPVKKGKQSITDTTTTLDENYDDGDGDDDPTENDDDTDAMIVEKKKSTKQSSASTSTSSISSGSKSKSKKSGQTNKKTKR